jgi:hypothetical protein
VREPVSRRRQPSPAPRVGGIGWCGRCRWYGRPGDARRGWCASRLTGGRVGVAGDRPGARAGLGVVAFGVQLHHPGAEDRVVHPKAVPLEGSGSAQLGCGGVDAASRSASAKARSASVPSSSPSGWAGRRDRGLRLLHRRHGVAAAAVCAVLHRIGHPPGPPGRGDRPPERRLGYPAGPHLLVALGERGRRLRFVLRDRDAKFSRTFDDLFCAEGAEVLLTPVRAPNANAHAERWIRTVRAECLDWLLIIGRGHLEQALRIYVEHYNRHRPHRALGLEPPGPSAGMTLVGEARRARGAPTRPPWWPASRVPASCMNAFTHPTGAPAVVSLSDELSRLCRPRNGLGRRMRDYPCARRARSRRRSSPSRWFGLRVPGESRPDRPGDQPGG